MKEVVVVVVSMTYLDVTAVSPHCKQLRLLLNSQTPHCRGDPVPDAEAMNALACLCATHIIFKKRREISQIYSPIQRINALISKLMIELIQGYILLI